MPAVPDDTAGGTWAYLSLKKEEFGPASVRRQAGAVRPSRSAWLMAQAALTRPMWLNACG